MGDSIMKKKEPQMKNKYLEAKRLGKKKPALPPKEYTPTRAEKFKTAKDNLVKRMNHYRNMSPNNHPEHLIAKEVATFKNHIDSLKQRHFKLSANMLTAKQLFQKNKAHAQIKLDKITESIKHVESMLQMIWNKPTEFTCKTCGQTFKAKAGLLSHVRAKHPIGDKGG